MRRFSLLLALLAVTACGKQAASPPTTKAPEPTPATTQPTEPVAAADAAAPSVDDVVAAPSEPETAVAPPSEVKGDALEVAARALIEAWLTAQNTSDLEAYSALYAPRFTGIKRSGTREKTYARDGWLTDRARMFKSAMRVSADKVQVELASGTAVVTLVQTWASGTYQDVGPKMFVLVPGKGGLAIAREEMLASELQGATAEAKPIDPNQFAFVISEGEDHWVLVPTDADIRAAATGAPRLAQKLDPTIVVSALDPARLDAGLASWLGRKVANGPECTATIDRLELVGRYTPHFGVVQAWNGTDGVEPIGKPLTDAEIAVSAWESSGLDVVLAGHLSGCAASWVHAAGQPEGPSYGNAPTDAAVEKKAIAAFRALPGWQAIQVEAAASEPAIASPWDSYQAAAPSVAVWADAAKSHTYVHVKAEAGNGCGEFGGAFGALFELGKDGDLVLISDPEGGPTETIVDVIDLDGDGDVEFLLEQGLIQRVGPIWQTTIDISPPYYDCPC